MTGHFNLMVALVVVLAAQVQSGPIGEKLATCCKSVNRQMIKEDITGYMIQKPAGSCVPAVIFQTARGLFCSQVTAPWVRRKIQAFERTKFRPFAAPLPTVSRISASPPTSSSFSTSSSWPSSSSFTPTSVRQSSPLPL